MFNKLTSEEVESVFNACYDGIYVCDRDLIGIWVNQSFERISGIPIEVWKGNSVYHLLEKGLFPNSVSLRVMEQRQQTTILQSFQSGKTALVTGIPIFHNGEIDKVVVTARDITDINRLSEELERSKLLSEQYQQELETMKLKEKVSKQIVSHSPQMKNTFDLSVRISQVDSPVLILGESGVGKEIIANLIHESSPRKQQPFITVNCGAIPKDLIESELFGYTSGSFTGAKKNGKPGLFEIANKGTVFLDEIGELPLELQVKLLRVLQDLKVTRIGGVTPIQLDIKIIAATNRDLEEMVRKSTFREDLYYRLNIIPITIPPLRNRIEDIPAFCNHFLNLYNQKYKKDKYLHHSIIELLERYHWPGNVRELQHLIERLVVTTEKQCIDIECLPSKYKEFTLAKEMTQGNFKDIMDNKEKEIIAHALRIHGSANKAAQALGLSQPTISRKMKKFQLS